MFTASQLGAWLLANGLPDDVAVSIDGEIPVEPDRIIVLTRNGGPGTAFERSFDLASVQIITRDGQGPASGDLTETLAQLVDDALMGVAGPVEIGGQRVISIDQQGGGPAFLDRDDARRVLYVCSYLFQVARAVN